MQKGEKETTIVSIVSSECTHHHQAMEGNIHFTGNIMIIIVFVETKTSLLLHLSLVVFYFINNSLSMEESIMRKMSIKDNQDEEVHQKDRNMTGMKYFDHHHLVMTRQPQLAVKCRRENEKVSFSQTLSSCYRHYTTMTINGNKRCRR